MPGIRGRRAWLQPGSGTFKCRAAGAGVGASVMSGRRHRPRRDARAAREDAVRMESERNPDYVDRLACKYMRKCKVDSSTESDSENEIFGQGPTSTPTHSTSKKTRSTKLKFLDPYDGDSEDTSTQSDSSLHSPFLRESSKGSMMKRAEDCKDQRATGLPDRKPSPGNLWHTPVTDPGDICMRNLTASQTPLQTAKKLWASGGSITGPSDISMDSGVISETRSANSSHCLLIGVDSKTLQPCAGSGTPAILGNVTSEENGNLCMISPSVSKRKMDFNNDKVRRKRARVTDYMKLPKKHRSKKEERQKLANNQEVGTLLSRPPRTPVTTRVTVNATSQGILTPPPFTESVTTQRLKRVTATETDDVADSNWDLKKRVRDLANMEMGHFPKSERMLPQCNI
ncbi:uncharacterized protein RCH25_016073 [Pelodytes ibericus]